MLVGDGGRTHFKASLGRLELLADGLLFSLGDAERLLGIEDIEVGGRHPKQGILTGSAKTRLGRNGRLAALLRGSNGGEV